MADVKVSALPAGTVTATSLVPVVTGGVTQRVTAGSIAALTGGGTVNTMGNNIPLEVTPETAKPLQDFSDQVVSALYNRIKQLDEAELTSLKVRTQFLVTGQLSAVNDLYVSGTLYYGASSPLRVGDDLSNLKGYELPPPTGDGYLRSDTDPDTGWYFAEPVIVSDTEPPAPGGGGAIWINPTEDPTPVTAPFSNLNPPVSVDPPIMETATTPLGIVNNTYIEPDVVGAVPIVVNGKRYLLPLLEAPASAALRTPLFEFADDPVHQQADGSWIGLDDTGMNYYQPDTVAGIPVVVGGKTYLLPLINE